MEGKKTTVRGEPAAIDSWVQTLSQPAAAAWSRGTEIERKVRISRNARWPICLIWSGEGHHPQTAVFLQPISDSEVAVTSVVPLDRKELSTDERQAALDAFRTALVVPRGKELAIEDKSSSADLSDAMSVQAVARFTFFARTANRTILHHGLDLPRWYDFLIQLHLDKIRPPRDVVAEALRANAFSEQVIRELLEIHDIAGELLSRYDAFEERE